MTISGSKSVKKGLKILKKPKFGLKIKCHFLFYYPELPRHSENKSCIFLPKKLLGTVHMLPVFSRKKLILCSKSSKKIKKFDQKLSLLVPKTF